MHLAGKTGTVAVESEVMGKGRNRGGKLGGIVVDPGTRREETIHHGCSRRSAERAWGVGVVEYYAVGREALDMGSLDRRAARDRQQSSRELVRHDKQDIGLFARHRALPIWTGATMFS